MNERASIGTGSGRGVGMGNVTRLRHLMAHLGLDQHAVYRQELMRLYIGYQVARLTNQRAMDKITSGQAPGPELSIAKMALTDNMTRTADLVSRVLGPRITADTGEWGTFAWGRMVCGTPGMRIAGGSDEVLRNIVGERVLGLPKDPGIDSKTPFSEMAKN
jgi:alkylation response protein AidB-like acyl-CoA dehydrogenase